MILALLACVKHYYTEPVAVSTRASVGLNARRLETVTADACDRMFFGVVFLGDERYAVDDLLDEVKAKGGDAVVDYRVENNGAFGLTFFLPLYMGQCWTITGTAATLTGGVTPNTVPSED